MVWIAPAFGLARGEVDGHDILPALVTDQQEIADRGHALGVAEGRILGRVGPV